MSTHAINYRSEARQAGYGLGVCMDVLILYAVNHLLEWGVPFITPAFADVLWALNLSLGTAIVINAAFIAFDPPWWRRLGRAAMDATALLSTYVLFTVFPFDLPTVWLTSLFAMTLMLLIVVLAISTVVHLVQAGADVVR